MTHARQQIREAVAAKVSGLTTTGSRVYQSRLHALRDSNLPCLLVNTDDEDIETELSLFNRRLDLKIRAVAKATADLDDALDTIAAEVEAVLGSGITAGGKRLFPSLTSIQVDMVDELEKPAGVITLTYSVPYFTAPGAPTVLI